MPCWIEINLMAIEPHQKTESVEQRFLFLFFFALLCIYSALYICIDIYTGDRICNICLHDRFENSNLTHNDIHMAAILIFKQKKICIHSPEYKPATNINSCTKFQEIKRQQKNREKFVPNKRRAFIMNITLLLLLCFA